MESDVGKAYMIMINSTCNFILSTSHGITSHTILEYNDKKKNRVSCQDHHDNHHALIFYFIYNKIIFFLI